MWRLCLKSLGRDAGPLFLPSEQTVRVSETPAGGMALCVPKSTLILASCVCFHEAESTPTPHLKHRAPERVGANCCLPASPCLPHTAPCWAKEWGALLQHGHRANRAGLIESWNIYLNTAVTPTPPPESLGLRLSPFHRSPKTPWLALVGEHPAPLL